MLAPIIVVQTIWFGRYHATGHATGHAAGHLASATTIFAVMFALAVLTWAARHNFVGDPNYGYSPPPS